MTISAAGNKAAARGFTLVELLVVLVVLALASGVVMMALPPGTTDAEKGADELAGIVSDLSDAAVIEARPRGLDMADGSPILFVYGEDGWRRVSLPRDRRLPEGLALAMTAGDDFALPEEDAERGELLFRARDGQRDDKAPKPVPAPPVVFGPAGDVTPFTVRIEGDRATFSLNVTGTGKAEVVRVEN